MSIKNGLITDLFLKRVEMEKKKNWGKEFEKAIKKSVPDYALLYRLPDSAQSFGGCNNLRFSRKNPFDFLLWDSKRHILYAIEAKTVSGKSISFERSKDENGEIHYHQVIGLNEWNEYDGITCGLIIEFREIEKTIFLRIEDYNDLVKVIDKKSFNYNDLIESKINFFIIQQQRKRTKYQYDIDDFLTKV